MNFTRSFHYVRRTFNPGEVARAFRLALERTGIDVVDVQFGISERLPGGATSDNRVSLKDLEPICDIATRSISYYNSAPDRTLYVSLSPYSDELYTLYLQSSGAEPLETVRQTFEETLRLEAPPPPDPDAGANQIAEALSTLINRSVNPLVERVEKLEAAITARSRRLRCFLSYRFNDANEIVALRIQQFLGLLDVEVLSGANYEPRQVSEKVLSKLREPLDFIVILITAAGESTWTRDEIGTAIHQGVGLVPIVEKGAKFEPVCSRTSNMWSTHLDTLVTPS